MKALIYFSGNLLDARGTPIRTRNIVKQLHEHGICVYYAGHDHPDEIPPERVLMLAHPLVRIGQIIRYVRKERIDVVYIQTSAAMWLVPFLRVFTRAKVGIDFHNRIYQEGRFYHHYSSAGTALREGLELLLCHLLAFGTSVSFTLGEFYRRSVPRFLVLPVGVDTARFAPMIAPRQDILAWKGESILIGYAGNLKWYQGLDTVLEAYRIVATKHPGEYSFLIIGSSGTDDTEAFVKEHGLDEHVRIIGKQPHEDIPAYLAAADILTIVRPSDIVTEYAFPSKFPEYAALGKALIVSRVSDMESYIRNGENGLLVEPGDVEGVARGFESLRDAGMRERLGKGARHLALEKFDVTILGGQLAEFLISLSRP